MVIYTHIFIYTILFFVRWIQTDVKPFGGDAVEYFKKNVDYARYGKNDTWNKINETQNVNDNGININGTQYLNDTWNKINETQNVNDNSSYRVPQPILGGCDYSRIAEDWNDVSDGNYDMDYILGGKYIEEARPWMAFIIRSSFKTVNFLNLLKTNKYVRCGGALLNKRYVITAGHCVCDPYFLFCKEGKTLYNPQEHYSVILGLSNYERLHSDQIYSKTKNVYGVERIIPHPKYKYENLNQDIALIRLQRDVLFDSLHLLPIKLPERGFNDEVNIARKPDSENRVYSAGWGSVKYKCTTDESGPVKFSLCKMKYGNYRNRFGKRIEQNCSLYSPPKPKSGLCADFNATLPSKYPKSKNEGLRIMDLKNKTEEKCYANIPGPVGWCRTYVRNNEGKYWGWCNPSVCNFEPVVQSRLKELRMMLLSSNHCKKFINWNKIYRGNADEHFNKTTEICAGTKKKFQIIRTYIKLAETGTYKHINDKNYETIFNKSGIPVIRKTYLNYYIGGDDTCSGDSGGPLYTWINGSPIIIGIVSRGAGGGSTNGSAGCGEYNYPGIYTRVSKYLGWIGENIFDGQCL